MKKDDDSIDGLPAPGGPRSVPLGRGGLGSGSASRALSELSAVLAPARARRGLIAVAVGVFLLLFVCLFSPEAPYVQAPADLAAQKSLDAEIAHLPRVNLSDTDSAVLAALGKQRAAFDARPKLADLGAYADRVRVLLELQALRGELLRRGSEGSALAAGGANAAASGAGAATADPTTSLSHAHDALFSAVFPFVRRSPDAPRDWSALRARYTEGPGLIIPVGSDQFQWAVHLISTLKHVHRTELPIEVVYVGDGDLPREQRTALAALAPDVRTVDLAGFFDEGLVGLDGGGWAIKTFALLASRFSEAIIADADAVFLQDPALLLRGAGYTRTGTYFFRDRRIFPGEGNVHTWWRSVLGARAPSAQLASSPWFTEHASREEMESGVVVIDKRRSDTLMGLLFVAYLNTRDVREQVTYVNTYGDKESFWMGFELLGVDYYLDGPYASLIGQLTHREGRGHSEASRICTDHILHLDENGEPIWFNGSLMSHKREPKQGWFLATHWAPSTGEWDCDPEPWCMVGIREEDVRKLKSYRVLTDMIGVALYYEGLNKGLLERVK